MTYTWRVVRKRRNDSAFQQLFSDFVSNKKELLTADITFFLCTWQTIYGPNIFTSLFRANEEMGIQGLTNYLS